MDLTTFLYICRKCGKQKKPTEDFCETCRTKRPVAKHAPPSSNTVQSQSSSTSASGSSPSPTPVTNDDTQALSSKEAPGKQHTGNKKPQNNTATPVQGGLLHYLFPVLRQTPVTPGQPRQKPSPLIKKPAPQQDNHHKGSTSPPPARISPDPGTQHKQQEGRPQKKQAGISQVVLGRNTQTEKDITISDKERTSGISMLGGTGTGKSTLLTGVALGDIKNGHGCLFVDVDGDSIGQLLPRIPKERMNDVILLDLVALAKKGRFLGINPLPNLKTNTDTEGDPDAAIDKYMHVFKMLWNIGKDTPRLENTLRASLLTLAYNNLTIAEMPFLLRDKQFRKRCIEAIPVTFATEGVRWFWKYDFDELYLQEQLKYSDSTLNKVLQFLMVRKVLYAVAQNKTTVQFRELMDTKKIVLLKLSVQELGETAVRFLGAFLMAELKNALFSRSDVEASTRSFFSLLADEWQLYVTSDFKEILTRGRKYGIGAVLANQTFSQLDEVDIALQGITNQVNTHIAFAVNEKDAATLAPYYARDPQPEYREQEKKLPVSNPFDWLVSGHTHTNEVVNRFADGTLRKMHISLSSEYAKDIRAEFNSFLYRAMTNSDALSLLCEKSSLSFLLRLNNYYPIGTYYFGQTVVNQPDVVTTYVSYSKLVSYSVLSYPHRGRPYSSPVSGTVYEHIDNMPTLLAGAYKDNAIDEHMANAFVALIQALGENQFNQASANFARLADAKFRKRIDAYLAEYETVYKENRSTISIYFKHLLPPEQEPAKWDNELQRWMTEERAAFETFIREFRDFVLALAANPILIGSGQYEMVEVGRRTIADMRNEKAQELLGLPNGIAYVAIRSRGDRFKPRMETKPLPYLNPTIAARLLTEHREQALKNAEDYTTEATMIGREVLKRRQRFGIASLSIVQTPQNADSTDTPVPITHARRRSQQLTPGHTPSLHLPSTTSDDDLLMSLYLFSYLKIDQLCRLLQKETSINNIRAKLKNLVDGGLVETQFLPRTTQAGKTPMIYSLTAKGMKTLGEMRGFTPDATVKRGGFSSHTLQVNDWLISAVLLPKVEPGITLVHFEHERLLKQRPIAIGNNKAVIPDGYVSYTLSPPYGTAGEVVGLCLEWDTGSESAYQWKDKLQAYTAFASGPYQERFGTDSLTIAVCLPAGEQRRLQQLVTLTEQVLENTRSYAELFLFAALDPASKNPIDLFTTPLFKQPFDTSLHRLIETMSN